MTWRTSTYSFSNGACVEVGGWRKSGRSMNHGACVEAGQGPGVVAVRDSRLGEASTVLEFSLPAWAEFTGRLGR